MVYNLLISLDQLANTLIGGNPDVTISSHLWSMQNQSKPWKRLRLVVDYTFSPIEKHHCELSNYADADKDYTDNFYGSLAVVVFGCALLFLPIRLLSVIKKGA